MATEDFTTYDETDGGGNVTVIAAKVSWNDMDRDETSHVSDSKGAAHFSGDFEHKLEFQYSDLGTTPLVAYWVLANAQKNYRALIVDDEDAHVFRIYNDDVAISVLENGDSTVDESLNLTSGTTYFLTIARDDDGGANSTGQLTADIHTGDYHPDGVHIDLLTVDCSVGEQNDFEFVYGLASYNSGHANQTIDGFTQNLDLQEAPPAGIPILRRRRECA